MDNFEETIKKLNLVIEKLKKQINLYEISTKQDHEKIIKMVRNIKQNNI
jgi:hypothetical protein